jgi:hypothetical protein
MLTAKWDRRTRGVKSTQLKGHLALEKERPARTREGESTEEGWAKGWINTCRVMRNGETEATKREEKARKNTQQSNANRSPRR